MKRLSVGVVVALAVMALTAVIAANAGTTQADQERKAAQAEVQPKLGDGRGAAGPGQESGFKRNAAPEDKAPFIGVTLSELPEAEAEELGIAGGAVVGRVVDDAPAAGLLAPGDVIVSVGGVDVSTAADVVQAVHAAEPGDTLSFAIIRDGETLTVEVEVGHRPFRAAPRAGHNAGPGNPVLSLLRQLSERLAKAEVVLETDDGFKTFRAVAGTLSALNVEEGTFTLNPVDGSDAIAYEISADTAVQTKHKGTLEGLNTTDRTLVVDVDGDVKLVQQGDAGVGKHRRGRPFGGRSHDFRPGPGGFPDIQGRLRSILPRLEGAGLDLRAFLERSHGAFGEGSESLSDTLRDIIGSGEGATQ